MGLGQNEISYLETYILHYLKQSFSQLIAQAKHSGHMAQFLLQMRKHTLQDYVFSADKTAMESTYDPF